MNSTLKNKFIEAKTIVDRFVDHTDLGEQQGYDIEWLENTYPQFAQQIRIYFYDNWELSYSRRDND